jgi:iron complex transport system ATP-binding protein
MSFELGDVWFRYPRSDDPALRGVSVRMPAGSHTAVVGPNGAGKTTLARLLLGTLRPQRGRALFEGRPAADWPRREMAQRVGVVPQGGSPGLPVDVIGFVEMGRNPYVRPWAPLGAEDRAKVSGALRRTDLEELATRAVTELSGGELQRAKLARAFAQDPTVLLLDEPTAHLDVAHEMEIFRLVREFVDAGGSAVTITHSLHLAGRFADRLCLLSGGRLEAAGSPPDVLRSEILSRVFDWPIEVVALDQAGLTGLHIVPVDRPRGPVRSEDLA